MGQFPGGHSNLTYAVAVGDRELVVRRPPVGSLVKSAHDMGREFRVLSALAPVLPTAPRPLAYCDDESLLGARFLVMERVPGLILRRDVPAGVDLGPSPARRLCETFVDTLCALHAIDYQAVGLGDFGKPVGYVARQVSGWTERYRKSQTDELVDMESLAPWLAAHLPETSEACVLHNDFKFDNMVLDPADLGTVRGILDWEMAAVGDPLMDLGTALSYWVEPGDAQELQLFRFGPTNLPGMLTREALVRHYGEASGRDVCGAVFYAAFGLFKTAVVAQQIYYRYKQGLTRDERFALFIEGVRVLARRAAVTLEQDRV